jgi:dienelactone hydrolase
VLHLELAALHQHSSKILSSGSQLVPEEQNIPAFDFTRIAVAGQSCGGPEAYDVANDTRVTAIGIFNSGEFTAATSSRVSSKITKPIF